MKIVHVSIYPPKEESNLRLGGVALFTKKLIRGIPYAETDRVYVLCDKVNGRREEYFEEGIKIIRCFDTNLLFVFQLWRELKKIKPAVVHIQQELNLYGGVINAYLLQWLVLLLRSSRVLLTLHGVVSFKLIDKNFVRENNSNQPIFLVKWAFYLIYKPLCLFARKIIVHENIFKQILTKDYGIKESKIKVIHLIVENLIPLTQIAARRKLGVSAEKNVVLFMGYLTGYKGLDLLLEGFAEYAKVDPQAFLIITAGKHPKLSSDKDYLKEYRRLEDKAKSLIVAKQYCWDGFVAEKEIINYYSAGDVSIYPYTIQMSSSGPMALAIGYGKPFLASEVFANLVDCPAMLFKRDKESFKTALVNFFKDKNQFYNQIIKLKRDRLPMEVGRLTLQEYQSN